MEIAERISEWVRTSKVFRCC